MPNMSTITVQHAVLGGLPSSEPLALATSSSLQDCFHAPPGTRSRLTQSGMRHPL